MTHVAHVITKLDVGGAQTHVAELALGQAAAGHRVEVVTGLAGPAADRLDAAGIPVRVVAELGDAHGRWSQRAAIGGVHRALADLRPELVHGHSSNGGLAARFAGRRLGRPTVYTAHGWPFQRGAAWRQRLMSYAGEFVGGHVGDAVIVLTQAEFDRAVRWRVVPGRRLWIVPNGISDVPPEQRRPERPRPGPPALVMVARFAPPKLQAELVGALARLADLAWTLTFVGDGPQAAACRALVDDLGLSDRVTFLGHRDDVADVLAASDVGVLWSRYEGLPISVIEYLRAGLCCACSDLPGTRALLGDPPAGVLGESADSLARLLADPDEVARLGTAARRRFVAEYSATAMVAATDAVYAAVLAGRRSRG